MLALPKLDRFDHLPEAGVSRCLVGNPVQLHGRGVKGTHRHLVPPFLIRGFPSPDALKTIPYSDIPGSPSCWVSDLSFRSLESLFSPPDTRLRNSFTASFQSEVYSPLSSRACPSRSAYCRTWQFALQHP